MTCFTGCFGQNRDTPDEQTTVDIDGDPAFSGIENVKLYTYGEIEMATDKFSSVNKIGEGGFGAVYKGKLNDGTLAAMKVLSAKSEQGIREFVNEIVAISGVEHENLVKLYGCCAERGQRILVYGYLENNSLARTLLSGRYSNNQFTWEIRTQICIGVARGLAFLHEEIKPHIVHRDIKASNILLDKDFTPKISDFGLAKLFPAAATHLSTRVAGTFGYLAPEYATQGKLTRKADVYSFGVLLLEIVSGRSNTNRRSSSGEQNLLGRAWTLYEKGKVVQLVDTSLGDAFDTDEACRYLKLGLRCTQHMPNYRPTMSDVLKRLKGEGDPDEGKMEKPCMLTETRTLKCPGNHEQHASSSESQTQDKFLSSEFETTHANMSFSSIYDRTN